MPRQLARKTKARGSAGGPTGENTRIVMDILRRLAHEESRCIIVVTHDPEVADTADLVLRMKDGVLTE